MRLATPDGNGGWLNNYRDKGAFGDFAEFDARRHPLAMHLAPFQVAHRRGYRFAPLDLDAKEVGADAVAEHQALLAGAAGEVGMQAVPVLSSPNGGRHLWLAGEELIPLALVEALAAAAKANCPSVDIRPLQNAYTGLLRPPGSHHRHGGRAVLLEHDVETAVGILSAGAPVSAFQELTALLSSRAAHLSHPRLILLPGGKKREQTSPASTEGKPKGELPPSITAKGEPCRAIVTGEDGAIRLDTPLREVSARTQVLLERKPDADEDHSNIAHGVLQGLALAGFERAGAEALARDPKRSPGLEWLRSTRGPSSRTRHDDEEFDRRLARGWFLAVHGASRWPKDRDHVPNQNDQDLAEIVRSLAIRVQRAGNKRWTKPSGPADLAVLAALSLLILAHRRREIIADVRSLGLMCGYSRETMSAAIARLLLDGWLTLVQEASGSRARVLTINESAAHTCPQTSSGHECAPIPVTHHVGSDTSDNAAPPARWKGELSELRGLLSTLGADIWGAPGIGHHAAWTLNAIENHPEPTSIEELAQTTGYRFRTVSRHTELLLQHGLVSLQAGRLHRTELTPTRASKATRTRGRGTGRAMIYYIERHVAAWWQGELDWQTSSLEEKRRRGQRAPANQLVLPMCAATARAYPRTSDGRPDHSTAWAIEAQRLEHSTILTKAYELESQGQAVDRLALAHDGTVRPLQSKITQPRPISAAA